MRLGNGIFIRPDAFNERNERMSIATVSARISEANLDHHLWNNNGTWWCHFTVHLPDFTKHRVRLSLETKDREEARLRRNALLHLFGTG